MQTCGKPFPFASCSIFGENAKCVILRLQENKFKVEAFGVEDPL